MNNITEIKYSCLFVGVFSLVLAGCLTSHRPPAIKKSSFLQVAKAIRNGRDLPARFLKSGPFRVRDHLDYSIPLSPSFSFDVDYFRPSHQEKVPLVLMVHGNAFFKSAHRIQAKVLASWGFHVVAVQVPNRNQWVQNGHRLARFIRLLQSYPDLLSAQIDPQKFVLVGHSFGGSAVTIAASKIKNIAGVILLDPAVVNHSLPKMMAQVKVPALILGADPKVFRARRRGWFYKYWAGPIAEVTMDQATHNDAQLPSVTQLRWGFDFETDRMRQHRFLSLIALGVFSLTGEHHQLAIFSRHTRPWLRAGWLRGFHRRLSL